MKSLLLTIFCFSVFALSAQEADTKSFAKQYAKKDGFTVVTISKAAMKLMTLFSKSDNDDMLSKIDRVQIISAEPRGQGNANSFTNEVLEFCKANLFEEIMEVEDAKEQVKIFCRSDEGKITDFIIWNYSQSDASTNLVCVNGKFTPENVSTMVNTRGKGIVGL